MDIDLKTEIQGKKTFLVVMQSRQYQDQILNLTLQMNSTFNRIAYISLNRLITPLRRQLEENKINVEKFFFIDGITKTAIPNPPSMNNTIFVPSPNDLTKLSIAVTKVLQTFDPDCIFFDSLSTLLIYEDMTIISQFVHSLINKINAYGIRAVLTCLEGDKEQQLIKDLSLILDKVISPQ
ncbi:hypothetical protein JW930_07805 [Candidatus Woesearchaeota archaeon]|nr:hypothetical protein [Candidatus Woesearchaeota archaeon]